MKSEWNLNSLIVRFAFIARTSKGWLESGFKGKEVSVGTGLTLTLSPIFQCWQGGDVLAAEVETEADGESHGQGVDANGRVDALLGL